MIRADAAATLTRWREVIAAAALAGFGLWLMALGGWVLGPAGLATMALAASLGLQALRRLRFATTPAAPGVVEVDEGQIAYLSATGGGFVSLPELASLRLVTRRGHRVWHLRQSDGQTLQIPVDATNAEALFDAFTALPGLDSGTLVAALGTGTTTAPATGTRLPATDSLSRTIWQRPARAGR